MSGNLTDIDNSEKTAAFRQALHPITIERVFTAGRSLFSTVSTSCPMDSAPAAFQT